MRRVHFVALCCALCVSSLAWGYQRVHIEADVSRDGVIETLSSPEELVAMLRLTLGYLVRSSDENLAERWEKVFTEPNWIRVSFQPAKILRVPAVKPDGPVRVSEILLLLPTTAQGRRWPEHMLLQTDAGMASLAKWSVCDIKDILELTQFPAKGEAEPFSQYREYCVTQGRYPVLMPAPSVCLILPRADAMSGSADTQ